MTKRQQIEGADENNDEYKDGCCPLRGGALNTGSYWC